MSNRELGQRSSKFQNPGFWWFLDSIVFFYSFHRVPADLIPSIVFLLIYFKCTLVKLRSSTTDSFRLTVSLTILQFVCVCEFYAYSNVSHLVVGVNSPWRLVGVCLNENLTGKYEVGAPQSGVMLPVAKWFATYVSGQ